MDKSQVKEADETKSKSSLHEPPCEAEAEAEANYTPQMRPSLRCRSPPQALIDHLSLIGQNRLNANNHISCVFSNSGLAAGQQLKTLSYSDGHQEPLPNNVVRTIAGTANELQNSGLRSIVDQVARILEMDKDFDAED